MTARKRPGDARARMAAPAPEPAFAEAGPTYPKRVSVPMTAAQGQALRKMVYEQNVAGSSIVRALLSLAAEREDLLNEAVARARLEG
jgi:hypothetical protein